MNSRLYTKHGLHLNEDRKLNLAQIIKEGVLGRNNVEEAKIERIEWWDEAEACIDAKLAHLPPKERAQVKSTFMEFKHVLAHSDHQPLGCTSAVKHVIRTGDAALIYK
uniref:Uncharacterized protein n=1 Tax=Graphocephala atropunctata TaxID=36148 RepID=A0A1B6LQ67_9HEMI